MFVLLSGNYANPSAIYSFAQKAKNSIEDARIYVARLLGAQHKEIVFTSGGTEANNLAIKGFCFANQAKGNHIVTSKIEHASVLNVFKFLETKSFNVTYLDVDKYGMVGVEQLKKSINKGTLLVSIMHANNEVGTIQPLEEIAAVCKKHNVCFHSDAVQSFGKLDFDVKAIGVDMASISAHKIYGPKGAGALYIKEGLNLEPLLHGGHQENELRAGTENVAAIAAFGEACCLRIKERTAEEAKIKKLRDILEDGIVKTIESVKINGHIQNRLYNTSNICIEGVEAQNVIINLDLEGFCVSSGSACQAKTLEPSHVLLAMGLTPKQCSGALRFSLGKLNKESEVRGLLKALTGIVKKLRAQSSHG
jgi:cysteine desulfurase